MLLGFSLKAQVQVSAQNYTVAQDGSGDYQTIQEAVNAIRDHAQVKAIIKVKNGIYHEKLVIPAWKKNISIIGESKDKTIIVYNDYSGKDFPQKDFTGNSTYSTYTSYTVLMQGNDCSLENLTVENSAGRVGQAVALAIEADRCEVRNCNILGNQDTLYTSKDGRNYFENCFITGTTDFIFGEATVIFQNCTIKSLADSYITAASTTKEQPFGYVFFNCELIAAEGVKKFFLEDLGGPMQKPFSLIPKWENILPMKVGTHGRAIKCFPKKRKQPFMQNIVVTETELTLRLGWNGLIS